MLAHVSKILVVAVWIIGSVCHAQSPGKADLEAAEAVAQLIGAPVFASDGTEIGQVADVSTDDEGRPDKIRMTTGSTLGFGTRTVEIATGAFTVVVGAVVLHLPADAAQWLPEPAERDTEK